MQTHYQLSWDLTLPNIPSIDGRPQIGLAGSFSGVFTLEQGAVFIFAGGTNFPEQSLLNAIKQGQKPQKQYQKDIYVLQQQTQSPTWQWRVLETQLPVGMAHGASVSIDDGILLFGGEAQLDKQTVTASDDIIKISCRDKKHQVETIGKMPMSFSHGAWVEYAGKVYLCGGVQNNQPSNRVQVYDLKDRIWSELPQYPGPARTELTATIGEDKSGRPHLYLFSGAIERANQTEASETYVKLDLTAPTVWSDSKIIQTAPGSAPLSLLGASATNLSRRHTLFLGGYNKQVFDRLLAKLQSTTDASAQQQAKIDFFSQPSSAFNWNKHPLIFDSVNEQWFTLESAPFDANCGASLQRLDDQLLLFCGEIKPGVRSNTAKLAKIHQQIEHS